ncbi:disease resistance protein RGA2-like [Chenopodium quinoa]|uniref:NB-ARC domain-containing protein n=1 Tax=Chenopodium quinoa TaxID=63459 RepID=A0A803KWQ6_CHEQI|nr:disease resistance protein RGA2-like [Chenopodium quinoa]
MSAEQVTLVNLKRTLSDSENEKLLSSMEELQALRESIVIVNGAVAAAMKKNYHSSGSSLKNLGAPLYQADDLVDEIIARYRSGRLSGVAAADLERNLRYALHRVVSASNRITEKAGVRFSFSVPSSPMAKLSKVLGELGKKLEEQHGSIDDDLPVSSVDPPHDYTLSENEVIGRQRYKDNIIDNLLKHRENETSVSVIPITGSAGIGKSALAQLVYDDERVKNHFDLRMWFQVSEIANEREIIQEIVCSFANRGSNYRRNPKPAKSQHLNGLTFRDMLGCRSIDTSGIHPNTSTSKDEENMENSFTTKEKEDEDVNNNYERRLRKEIEGKLYLLVLDHVSIKKYGSPLKKLLAAGARGSRILWTTRLFEGPIFAKNEIMKFYKLQGLSEDDSKRLFNRFAFGKDSQEIEEKTTMVTEIVKNCDFVPLTVKVAASFLYDKNKDQWSCFTKELKDNKDKFEHVLHVSYNDLPTRLKACLNYCSLFPEDFRFNKHDLISLWIAQGFVHPPNQGESLEDAAEKYFLELSRRCFFEDVTTDCLGKIVTCKMTHIMCRKELQYSAGVESLHMTDKGVSLETTCKHVSLTCNQDSLKNISSSVLQAQSLRALFLVKEPDCDAKIDSLQCNTLISSFKCLRVLDLHDLGIEELPISIGKLIHLRYLDLSRNDGLETLPKSVTKLYNLQTLKLNSCTKLRRLLGNFGELTNLTRFEVDECDSLPCMPLGVEQLTKLKTMSRFVVGQDCCKDMVSSGLKALEKLNFLREDMVSSGLKALENLNDLRGRLEIELKRGWTATIEEASKAKLNEKIHLDKLKISWAKTVSNCKDTSQSSHNSNQEKVSHRQLLDNLQPNPELKILCIEGYKGQDFPDWAGVSMLASSLPNLIEISIEGCDKCTHLPPFGKLEYLKRLTLRHMANVKYVQREPFHQEPSPASPFFQNLEELNLHNFYKLKGWWKEKVPIKSKEQIPSFPRLSKLRIWNCPKLRSMPLFSGVEELDLRNINQMLLEESSKNFPTETHSIVKCLQIKDCSTLSSFAEVKKGLGGLASLKQLVIEKCHSLSSLASELSNLKSLGVLEISNCKELDLSDYVSNPWTSLASLHHLTLRDIPKMKTLPEGLKSVKTLKSLCISACTSLTELPSWINCLTALQHLQIKSCEAVTRLPNELKEVNSLKKVEITECSALMERCREPTGDDWHKIRHARVLLHKSWRYGHTSQNRSNVRALTDVKYIVIPIIAADT